MSYADLYDPDVDFDAWYTDVTGSALAARVRAGATVLELGCATGRMTEALVAAGASVVAVDHSPAYLERAADRCLPAVEWIEADVESHVQTEDRRFDHVVATNLVHELADPLAFVGAAAACLRPSGHLHLTLQNPRSLHRLVAVEMGLIDELDEISDRGHAFGTRRMLGRAELEQLGTANRLRVVASTGLCLKPLPNAEMARLAPAVLAGFAAAARHVPDVAAINYVVFGRD